MTKSLIKCDKIIKNNFSANENFDATFPTKIVVSHNGDISQIPPGSTDLF